MAGNRLKKKKEGLQLKRKYLAHSTGKKRKKKKISLAREKSFTPRSLF